MANASWAGCIEARPYPLDVTDTAADPGTPETMFVPMFAPDEPDGYSNQYITNNYLNDQYSYYSNGGHKHGSTWHRHGSGGPYEWDQAQGNVNKYYPGVYASQSGVNGSTRGPNYQCQAKPITPLTNTRAIIDTALDDMVANGWTNIHMATMWGWRVLSSGAPFTQGMPEETPHNHKVIILMTDGANTHVGVNSPNKSMYSPYGFASNGRLRSPTSNTSLLVEAMDDRTEQACANAKQHGILVYTVAFDLYDSGTVQMLRECASNPEMAFTPESGSDLVSTFQAIAAELSALRVAE
jgi:hypothetical protein